MVLGEYIDPLIFLVSLALGLFYTYISIPQPQIVMKYPTPFNAGTITYVDSRDSCYRYGIEKVKCPVDQSKIMKF